MLMHFGTVQMVRVGLQAKCKRLVEQLLEGLHVPGPDGTYQEHRRSHGLPQRGSACTLQNNAKRRYHKITHTCILLEQ